MIIIFPLIAQAAVAGKVEYVSGDAWTLRQADKITLFRNSIIHAEDVIVTGSVGRIKLVMNDKSIIYVGRQSRISIDRYDMKDNSLLFGSFNMLWGKVRFLVHKLKVGMGNFSVQTKTATIGVRGTDFSVVLDKPETFGAIKPTTVMLFEGAVVGTSIRGRVIDIKPGRLVKFKPDGTFLARNIRSMDVEKLGVHPLETKWKGIPESKPEPLSRQSEPATSLPVKSPKKRGMTHLPAEIPVKKKSSVSKVFRPSKTAGKGLGPKVDLPTNNPTMPRIKPTVPLIKPTVPLIKPTVPLIKPTVPLIKPTVPLIKPTVPLIKPTVPLINPTVPLINPTVPLINPTVPLINPTPPAVKKPPSPAIKKPKLPAVKKPPSPAVKKPKSPVV
ncbi:MAG: FecR domain-containing protein [Mariprofundaceae bacterium]